MHFLSTQLAPDRSKPPLRFWTSGEIGTLLKAKKQHWLSMVADLSQLVRQASLATWTNQVGHGLET